MKILVTSYENPDMDGIGCAYAYAELLQAQGKDAIAAVFGTPHQEAKFVLERFAVPSLPDAQKYANSPIILVDTSNPADLYQSVNPADVIEIIDHRASAEGHLFPNAKKQIELVGAAATLIAEKFEKKDISKKAAALLYCAIISNTVNFKAMWTQRDRDAANWLLEKFELPENFIHDMFVAKSKFTQPIKDVLIADLTQHKLADKMIGAAQLEIVEAEKFMTENSDELTIALREICEENKFDNIYLSCVDIEKEYNILLVINENGKNMISKALHVTFNGSFARTSHIIMRKQITPRIREVLENDTKMHTQD